MATTVEEWLDEGNQVTREAPIIERGGHRWRRDRETTADYVCLDCGVRGHTRSNLTKNIRAFVCAGHGCTEDGKHQVNALFWCDDHINSNRSTR